MLYFFHLFPLVISYRSWKVQSTSSIYRYISNGAIYSKVSYNIFIIIGLVLTQAVGAYGGLVIPVVYLFICLCGLFIYFFIYFVMIFRADILY
jgi:hypothetical protein